MRSHSDLIQCVWPGAFLCARVDQNAGTFMCMDCAMERNVVTILGRMSRYISDLVVGRGDPRLKERKAFDRLQLSAVGAMASARRGSAGYTSPRRSALRNVREAQSWKDDRSWAEAAYLDPYEVTAFSHELDCWRRRMLRMSIANGREVANIPRQSEDGQTLLAKQACLERDGAADPVAAMHDILTLAVRNLRTKGQAAACESSGTRIADKASAGDLAPAMPPMPIAAVAAE